MKSFPYSRHSSYKELRHLVGKFRPLDVYPCVVDENNWSESRSIRALFGDLCCGDWFAHDEEMHLLQVQLQRDTESEVVPDHNIGFSERGSSQLVLEESQWRDSDPEDLNGRKWLEQLRMLQLPMATNSAKMKTMSPMKKVLKREAPDRDSKDGGLIIREKRSKVGLETSTQRTRVKKQGIQCERQKIKIEPLSGKEEEPVVIKTEPHVERVKEETDGEDGGKEAREGEPGDTIDETHLLVDLRGNHSRSQAPQKRTDVSSLPLDDRPQRNGNEWCSSKGWGNENQKSHASWSQNIGGGGGAKGNHLAEEQKYPVTTQSSAQPTRIYQGKVLPDAANQNSSSTSNTRAQKTVFGIHITGHLPLPLPDIDEDFDLQKLREATMSALQISGRSWWNVNLQSTRRKWMYETEVEL